MTIIHSSSFVLSVCYPIILYSLPTLIFSQFSLFPIYIPVIVFFYLSTSKNAASPNQKNRALTIWPRLPLSVGPREPELEVRRSLDVADEYVPVFPWWSVAWSYSSVVARNTWTTWVFEHRRHHFALVIKEHQPSLAVLKTHHLTPHGMSQLRSTSRYCQLLL